MKVERGSNYPAFFVWCRKVKRSSWQLVLYFPKEAGLKNTLKGKKLFL